MDFILFITSSTNGKTLKFNKLISILEVYLVSYKSCISVSINIFLSLYLDRHQRHYKCSKRSKECAHLFYTQMCRTNQIMVPVPPLFNLFKWISLFLIVVVKQLLLYVTKWIYKFHGDLQISKLSHFVQCHFPW